LYLILSVFFKINGIGEGGEFFVKRESMALDFLRREEGGMARTRTACLFLGS